MTMMLSSSGKAHLIQHHAYTEHSFRSTLADPTFVRIVQENDILVWGGDIRDRDAWSGWSCRAASFVFLLTTPL